MAFWAMGALDKVKNITEKLNMKQMGTKLISYVAVQNQQKSQTDAFSNIGRSSNKKIEDTPSKPSKPELSQKELMEIQLKEYKKLIILQNKVLDKWRKKQREELQIKQEMLEKKKMQLIESEEIERKQQQKARLMHDLTSGKKSIQDVIHENILIKERIFNAKLK